MKEREVTSILMKQLPTLLPRDVVPVGIWTEREDLLSSQRYDIDVKVKTPTKDLRLIIEVKNTDRIAPLREAAQQVRQYAQAQGAIPIVGNVFLGERAKDILKEEGVGYIDLAGNFYIRQNDLLLERVVDRNPFTNTQPLKNLFAPVSSRITRAMLIEPKREWQLGELSTVVEVSLGQASSVIERMIKEEFVFWNNDKKIQLKDPATLLEAWKQVYPTYNQQKITLFSYERDYAAVLDSILQAGQRENLPYALGFFTGADIIAPFIRGLSKVQIYIPSIGDLAKWKMALNLQDTQRGGNVEIYIPYDQGIFYQTQQIKSKIVEDVPVVSNVQLYMDLFNDPARGEEAAQYLREKKLHY